jgi:hypothetical protein
LYGLQDPRQIINVLKALNHLKMGRLAKKTAEKYMVMFYKLENCDEYLKFVQESKVLTVTEDHEKDFALLYLVKLCLNISELNSKMVMF